MKIERCWYEDEDGKEVEPDTITGEYSDMPHVLSFLGRSYDQVFNILMQDDKIASLMAPFKSAYENKANDQLEGMVGTLRVNAARLVSPEAYWVFTGDDFDLKISDKAHPSYLVPATKIADMATGWLAGQAARDFTATDERMLNHFDIEQSEEFKTTKYFCKTHFDMKKIKDEEDHYVPLPKIYEFKNDREKEIMLNRNFKRVNDEVEKMVKELLGMA